MRRMDSLELWHASPRANEEKIDRDGLCPRFTWVTTYSDDAPERVWQIEPIHVSLEFAIADFIGDLHGCDEVVVYRVEPWSLTLQPGFDGPGTFAIYEWVPPSLMTKDHIHTMAVPK